MKLVLAIAFGGAFGAVSRHYLAGYVTRLMGTEFPYGTFAVNILGSFLMGVLVALFAFKWNVEQEVRAFLTVGLLGGFTTFSTYSLETVLLIERGTWSLAGLYMLGSLGVGVMALFAGMWAIKVML